MSTLRKRGDNPSCQNKSPPKLTILQYRRHGHFKCTTPTKTPRRNSLPHLSRTGLFIWKRTGTSASPSQKRTRTLAQVAADVPPLVFALKHLPLRPPPNAAAAVSALCGAFARRHPEIDFPVVRRRNEWESLLDIRNTTCIRTWASTPGETGAEYSFSLHGRLRIDRAGWFFAGCAVTF